LTDRIKDIKDLLKMAKGISSKIAGTSSTSLRLDCLSNIGVQTTTIHAGNPFARWVRGMVKDEVKFDPATVYNVRIIEMRPSMREIPGAVHRSDDVLTIDFKECLKSEMFRLEIQYRMEGDYLKSLVDSRSSPEPFEQETKYKLSAQLIDPHSLIEGFSEVDVNEYPVTSSVYVRENIDTAIPGLETLRELRKLEEDMFTNYDPRAGFKLASQQHKRFALRRQLREQNPREVLRALTCCFFPHTSESTSGWKRISGIMDAIGAQVSLRWRKMYSFQKKCKS